MVNLKKESDFFHFIADSVIEIVSDRDQKIMIAKHKRDGDFATEVDVKVENMIVAEIKKRFPEDHILAEENSNDTVIGNERIWIIDPICGTNNLARGIKNFCTNIALAENNKLIASCVIDHSLNNYYWSIGDGKVFINETLFVPEEQFDVYVEVDFGAVAVVNKAMKEKHNKMLKKLVTETNYYLISLNTSLGFAYTAIGKVNGVVNIFCNPWDVSAACFLIMQSGGIITELSGKEWTLQSVGMIAADNLSLHNELLEAYASS
jgi:myo-inositol-1(or 4)-monophosphatase